MQEYCDTLPEKVKVFMDETNPNRQNAFHDICSSNHSLDCAAYSIAKWLTSHHNVAKSTMLVNIMLRSGRVSGRIVYQKVTGEECETLFNVLEKLILSYPKVYVNTYI